MEMPIVRGDGEVVGMEIPSEIAPIGIRVMDVIWSRLVPEPGLTTLKAPGAIDRSGARCAPRFASVLASSGRDRSHQPLLIPPAAVVIMRVPDSGKFPEGVKYRLHFGTVDGETIVRYDNSHGVHERHEGDEVEHIEFPGVEALVERFEADIADRL